MRRHLRNIYRLGVKELRSLADDRILLGVIFFAFTLGTYAAGTDRSHELHHSSIAIVDQDGSPLTRQIAAAFYPPYFLEPQPISWAEREPVLARGKASFALVFPPGFQRDLLAGRRPEVQLDVDATNVGQAFIGAGYAQAIVSREVAEFLGRGADQAALPIELTSRVRFNPNLDSSWFGGSMETINHITLLSIVLVGAALLREREHGTIEHLLVMPVTPLEIMVAKVWANGLVVLLAAALSIEAVVQGLLDVPVAGSVPLFLFGAGIYLFSSAAIGIYLGTLARSMPQFGLLIILVILPLSMLSGTVTPRESMPAGIQDIMLLAPTTHFVRLAQGILFRGAGIEVVWPSLAAIAGLGALFFYLSLRRFRLAVTRTQG